MRNPGAATVLAALRFDASRLRENAPLPALPPGQPPAPPQFPAIDRRRRPLLRPRAPRHRNLHRPRRGAGVPHARKHGPAGDRGDAALPLPARSRQRVGRRDRPQLSRRQLPARGRVPADGGGAGGVPRSPRGAAAPRRAARRRDAAGRVALPDHRRRCRGSGARIRDRRGRRPTASRPRPPGAPCPAASKTPTAGRSRPRGFPHSSSAASSRDATGCCCSPRRSDRAA